MSDGKRRNGRIKAVIFDMNGVVVQPVYEKLYRYILEAPAAIAAKSKRVSGASEKYQRLYIETRKLDGDVMGIAARLRKNGFKTPALSNVDPEDIGPARALGAYDGFDPVVLSGEEGISKPDPRIYELVASRAGLRCDECVFVDDNEEFVEAAVAVGFYGIVFRGAAKLVEDLMKLGIRV
jgi:epoxide hydrolase-like predicted phosphatase